jgi:hypothetical protein
MSVERRGPAVCNGSNNKGGKGPHAAHLALLNRSFDSRLLSFAASGKEKGASVEGASTSFIDLAPPPV